MTPHAEPGATERAAVQASVGDELWSRGDNVAAYATRELRPVEVLLLVRYREALSRRVMEIGCGAGRLTGYLAEIGSAEGVDVSPAMVGYCRDHYPAGSFRQADMRDLSSWGSGSLDAIFASNNVLDVLDHDARQAVLDELRRLLAADGTLFFSSHNAAAADAIPTPLAVTPARNPVRLARNVVRLPRRMSNHARLRRFEHVEREYAILNDNAHDFSILHYYIGRDEQASQLAAHGFELVECLDLDGRAVGPGERAAHAHELHYVARPMR